MDELFPSTKPWKDLYLTAIEFRDLQPWNWMADEDIFGVQNPVNNEIGYCCIMGALGEVLALAVYLGTEGLTTYLNILSGDHPFEEIMYSQKCLMASFENRADLAPPDLQQIKSLGLKFRGRNAWPLFRNYQPGYHPWYLEIAEAEFLTTALRQSIEVATRVRQNRKLLKSPKKGHFFVRVPKREENTIIWQDAWLQPAPWQPEFVVPRPNEVLLQKLKTRVSKTLSIWEFDCFYAPMGVSDGTRPYFPLVLMGVDQKSGLALVMHLSELDNYQSEFQQQLINLLEKLGIVPETILVGREDLFRLFEPVTTELKVPMKLVKKLKALHQVKDSLFDHFRSSQ